MHTIDDCFLKIRALYAKDEFSDDEIRGILKDMERIRDSMGPEAFTKYTDEYLAKLEREEGDKIKRKIVTLQKGKILKAQVSDGSMKPADVYSRAVNVFTGSAKASEGSNYSISVLQQVRQRLMRQRLDLALEKAGLQDVSNTDEFSRMLRKELYEKGSVKDHRIAAVADTVRENFKYIVSEARRLGLPMGEIDNYAGWQSWSKLKITGVGEEEFVKDMLGALDHKKTFEPWMTTEEKVAQITASREHILMGDGGVGSANFTKTRSLHFADGDGAHDMLVKYGNYPSATESMMAQYTAAAKRLALVERLGPNVEQGFENYKNYVEKLAPRPKPQDAKPASFGERLDRISLESQYAATPLDRFYDAAIGNGGNRNSVIAKSGAAIRSITSMQVLGLSTLTAVPTDLPMAAALLRTVDGQGWLGSDIANVIGQYTKLALNKEERHATMQMMGIWADEMNSSVLSGRGELSNAQPPGLVADAARVFFKANGLHLHDEATQAALSKLIGMRLANHVESEFSALPEMLKTNLKRYSIAEPEWNALRKAVATFDDGSKAITPQAIWDLKGSDLPKGVTRSDLYNKLASAMLDISQKPILRSDAFTQTLLTQGTKEDTLVGQMWRMFAQFKNAPIQQTRLLSRVYNAGGVGDLAQVAGVLTMGGIAANAMRDVANNKTPVNPAHDSHAAATVVKEGMIRGGAAGLFGDYLTAEYNKDYRNFAESMAGPVIGNVSEGVKLLASAARGRDEFYPKRQEALRYAVRQVPFNNLWWAKMAFENTVLSGLQEHLSPGYAIRMDQKLNAQGQQRIFPAVGAASNKKTVLGGQ